LTWASFKYLISNRFTPKYQELQDGINLVQI
jgi:hypothetical protein